MFQEIRDRFFGEEDPEKTKLNVDLEFWAVMGIEWDLKKRRAKIFYSDMDYETVDEVHRLLIDDIEQEVRGSSFGTDEMEVEFNFKTPHTVSFDKSKETLWVN